MTKQRSVCTTLPDSQIDDLDRIAERLGMTRSELVRAMIVMCIPIVKAGHGFNLPRLLIIAEYMRSGVDALLTKLVPEEAERVPMVALAAMEKHHAPAK